MKPKNWLRWMGGLVATVVAPMTLAADHTDAPGAIADPASDITDVYSWMDGPNVVLVMNVLPGATTGAKFSDKTLYVFHTANGKAFNDAPNAVDVVCGFDAAAKQNVECWVGTNPVKDYVKGDASDPTTGATSASGKVKVFAGLRDDPFFFNLAGFKAATGAVKQAIQSADGGFPFPVDAAGCPTLGSTADQLAGLLGTDPASEGGPAKDAFAGKNVLSIVVSLDKALVTDKGNFVSVWGSTNKK